MGKGGERSKDRSHATTFWLASDVRIPKVKKNLQPFGWASLNELTDNLEIDFVKQEKDYQKERSVELQERKHEKKRQSNLKERAAEAEEQKEKEAEEKRIAAERLKEELEAMSPEDRLLAKFDDGSITEEQINIAYKNLDDFSEEHAERVAARLKKYWQDTKKWTKNEVGKKQWKKVRERNEKINKVIGET